MTAPAASSRRPSPTAPEQRRVAPPSVDLADLPGVDPAWSRHVETSCSDGVRRTWHVLDNAPDLGGREVAGTLLAVHGNPTWSYLWRGLLAAAAAPELARPWRVLAVDQLGMGLSDRTPPADGGPWRLAARVRDLALLTDTLRAPLDDAAPLQGPVVPVGHDWGGVVACGWAVDHPDELAGLVLTNTAVHAPADAALPPALQLATAPGVQDAATRRTDAFLRTTLALARPGLPREVRAAYRAPYASAADRRGVADFVTDIPWRAGDPSRPELDRIADGLLTLDVPALLLWGPGDPVFGDRYLRDLRDRLPHAQVHRFEGASHLVVEDADVAGTLLHWLGRPASERAHPAPAVLGGTSTGAQPAPLWSALERRADDDAPAVVDMAGGADGAPVVLTWRELGHRVAEVAAGLHQVGVRPGDRVSLLVPPGADLTVALYACLRLGAVVVVADAGLGVRGLHRAVRGAGPRYVVGVPRALAAARALGWPGERIAAGPLPATTRSALGVLATLPELAALGRRDGRLTLRTLELAAPGPDDEAAVLFTSGSTGPAKGAVYTHRGLAGTCDTVAAAYGVGKATSLVAAFAPFALLGPALGAASTSPAMDVTAPGTLTASALAAAVEAAGATTVFASPAALANVLATAPDLSPAARAVLGTVQHVLSAGAPVPAPLLRRLAEVMPGATLHTPYGMTEVLPVTDVTLQEVEAAGLGPGILVGRPLPGIAVAVAPLDGTGAASGAPTASPGVVGEILVRAQHLKARYDQLWRTEDQARATDPDGGWWHRTGDVGRLDDAGRLWVEGRTAHLVRTAGGVVTPVGVELAAQGVDGVRRAAAVGVGPEGTQALVVVAETEPPARRAGLAPAEVVEGVRSAVGRVVPAELGATPVDVAAVLTVPSLPTDIRHNSKIDRTAVAAWAARVLEGRAVRPPWQRRSRSPRPGVS